MIKILIGKKANKLRDEAYKLTKMYDFDQDDGGGGSTKADREAGARYMKLWDDIEALEEKSSRVSRDKATQAIVDKYGDTAITQIKRRDNAKALALVGAFFAVPLATVILASR